MKLILSFLAILSWGAANAQLSISPSNTADSYVYVKNRMFYVEQDIQLFKNKNEETQASIYLRHEAQLLQGDKNISQNSGNGLLSIFQEGTSNAYDYNYWSMPVTNNQNTENYFGELIFEPLASTHSRIAKITSALDGVSSPLTISNQWIYKFTGNEYHNWEYVGELFKVEPGEGFSMKGVNGTNLTNIDGVLVNTGNSQLYDFRGMPNSGSYSLKIEKDQVILAGNPYPSALNLDQFLTENISTTGIAYFWDSNEEVNSHYLEDYEGGYGAYSPGIGIYVPAIFRKYTNNENFTETGVSGKQYGRKFAPVAQGFMLIGNEGGMVNFKNSYRVYQKEQIGLSEFKTVDNSNTALVPYFRLQVEIDDALVRPLVLAFREDATPGSDHAMDAKTLDLAVSDAGWDILDEFYVINVRPLVSEEKIPLILNLQKNCDVLFKVSEFFKFDPARLFLYDSADDLYYPIKATSIKLNLPTGYHKNRFYISFIDELPETVTPAVTPSSDDQIAKPQIILLNSVSIFQNNALGQLEIKMLYDSEIARLTLYDLNGKLIFNENFKDKKKEFTFSTQTLSTAIYIAKINTTDNKELTKKISIKN